MKSLLISLLLTVSLQHNPVYNVRESDPSKDPNRGLVPQITTNYESMLVDRTKRIITLGESQKSGNQVEFSPVRQYDEDVEFVSDKKPEGKGIYRIFSRGGKVRRQGTKGQRDVNRTDDLLIIRIAVGRRSKTVLEGRRVPSLIVPHYNRKRQLTLVAARNPHSRPSP